MPARPHRPQRRALGAGDVFELLLAEIPERKVELAGGVLLNARRYADAARFGQSFEARGDVDAVAKDVAVLLDDDVALMDADAEFDAGIGCDREVPLRHLRLDFAGTAQSVAGAGELGQQAVPGGLDDATVMRGDARVYQLGADRLEPPQGGLLVASDLPRVARHIGGENGGQTTGCGHVKDG